MSFLFKSLFLGVTAATLVSCSQEDQVELIDVKLPPIDYTARQQTSRMSDQKADYDMLLAFVIPTSSKQWFVKATIYAKEFEQVRPILDSLRETLVIDENSQDVVTLKLVNGWQQRIETGFLHSTLVRPGIKSRVTFSTAGGSLLSNVNRWNQQLENDEVKELDLPKLVSETTINGRYALVVKLEKGMSLNPVDNVKGEPVETSLFSFVNPEGWILNPPSGMRKIDIKFDNSELSVIGLPARMQQSAPNINRWRRQIGLEPETEEQIQAKLSELKVDGKDAHFIDLVGKEKSILVVMVKSGDKMWFIKAMGPNEEIRKNAIKFAAFVEQFKFKEVTK